jgi:cytochrome c-type biogenesis protein CcmE
MTRTRDAAKKPKRKALTRQQIKWLAGGVVVALAVGYLIFVAANQATAYYLTVSEVYEHGPSARYVRVAGKVVGESIVWEPRSLRLEFDLVDEGGLMAVVYDGPRPDMFRDQADVIVEGRLLPEGVFVAHSMILKCPSKYQETP